MTPRGGSAGRAGAQAPPEVGHFFSLCAFGSLSLEKQLPSEGERRRRGGQVEATAPGIEGGRGRCSDLLGDCS